MVNQNWFSASIPKAFGMVKIATFAKPENVMGKFKNKDSLRKPKG
jgi:hypothetical protein